MTTFNNEALLKAWDEDRLEGWDRQFGYDQYWIQYMGELQEPYRQYLREMEPMNPAAYGHLSEYDETYDDSSMFLQEEWEEYQKMQAQQERPKLKEHFPNRL